MGDSFSLLRYMWVFSLPQSSGLCLSSLSVIVLKNFGKLNSISKLCESGWTNTSAKVAFSLLFFETVFESEKLFIMAV